MSLRLLLLGLTCLALAGCGGSDSSQETDEATDARAGYFHEAESKNLNPPLAQYSAAWMEYTKDPDACNKKAARLFAAGASPRKAVQCHVRENQALIDGATSIRAAVSKLDGDYRATCATEVERFAGAVDEVNMARKRVLKSWNVYASKGVVQPKLQQYTTTADKLSLRFLDKDVSGLRNACYTEADRA